jgi:regulator of sigma E protease
VGSTRIEAVMPDGAAAAAGVQPGDVVVSVAGQEVVGFPDIQRIVMARSGEPLELVLDRNGEALKLEVTPRAGEIDDGFGGKVKVGLIGIQSAAGASSFERKGPLEALALGVGETWDIVSGTFHFLGRMVNGRESAEHLGGPLAIAQISGRAASMGFFELMRLAAAISVSIGLINLFPIPMLDGGHLVYYAIEAARGRPLGAQAQEIGFKIGFALVLAMMVFSTWNDLLRLVRF